MAEQRDLISRLADRGEEVLAKAPLAQRALALVDSTRERLDDLQKRVIGLESLERRLDELDRRVRTIEKSAAPPARKPAARNPAPKKPPAAKDPAPKP